MKRLLPPFLLNAPALIIFVVMLVVPMVMTLILSFKSFDFYGGIQPNYGWHNYLEVFQDSYFHEIFLRTYGISVGVTLICALIGAPEAYILSRMFWPDYPVPIGVIRRVKKPTHHQLIAGQIELVRADKGEGVLRDLLFTSDTWEASGPQPWSSSPTT